MRPGLAPRKNERFSACFAGGLIEARRTAARSADESRFSACFAGGLIEAWRRRTRPAALRGFPPVLQAASLKHHLPADDAHESGVFSACFAGGLIEAADSVRRGPRRRRFPPVLQAASLKLPVLVTADSPRRVFRLFCRRPH